MALSPHSFPARVPVLDRLADRGEGDAPPRHGRVLDFDGLVASILVNLERVFTTRSPLSVRDAATVGRTLANYGMPHIRGAVFDARRVSQEIVDAVLATVEAYEPRILSPAIAAGVDPENGSVLRLTVRGTVRIENHVRPVQFELSVPIERDPNRQRRR